ncbi:MAG: methylmalonyl-CoA mutase [Candidatus Reddybacter sp.]
MSDLNKKNRKNGGFIGNPPIPTPATSSGIEIPKVLTPENDENALLPGQYPFTRGVFEDGYRGRLWTFRQYSGFGSAEDTNKRFRWLLDQGQTGLSVALDLPTQCGYDPSNPVATPEVGKVGVSISNLSEMELLFDGIDLSKISTSFTINGTAAIIYAMYLACADKLGVPRAKLTGTIQNDILKEYVARGTWIFPVKPSMRLTSDVLMFANQQSPRFNAISVAGAHVRDAGSTAVEELGYTLANGLAYVEELKQRGGDIELLAQRLSFFFYVHMDFFEEICKFRAARRLWAKLLKTRYGITNEKSLRLRFGVVCGGSSLVAPQPQNNIVRVAVETMSAVLGGAQSIFTCAYDEAFQIPTERSAEIALRTQQIIAFESGISKTVDPLGGSYFVEDLTDKMEQETLEVIDELDEYGGVIKAIEEGYIQSKIANRALERKKEIDSGETVVVGQNWFRRENQKNEHGETFSLDPETANRVTEKYHALKASRDDQAVTQSLEKLEAAAITDTENVMPLLVDCCHAYATVEEMVNTLTKVWGEFQEPLGL